MRSLSVGTLIVLAACGNAVMPPTSGGLAMPTTLPAIVATATSVPAPLPSPPHAEVDLMPEPSQTPLPAATATLGVVVDPALVERARERGNVRIIVTLDVQWRPEGELPDEAAVQAQRQAIADAQGALLSRLSAYNLTDVYFYQYIPSLAMVVDASALEALIADPGVLSIQADAIAAPSGGVSAPQ